MNFDACLQAAIAAGEADPARGRLTQDEHLDLVCAGGLAFRQPGIWQPGIWRPVPVPASCASR